MPQPTLPVFTRRAADVVCAASTATCSVPVSVSTPDGAWCAKHVRTASRRPAPDVLTSSRSSWGCSLTATVCLGRAVMRTQRVAVSPHLSYAVARRMYAERHGAADARTTAVNAEALPVTSSYAAAVDCDAYALDIRPLHRATIAGHALPGPVSDLPDKANVVVIRGFSVKNKLTPRMQSVLRALIDAHVEQWESGTVEEKRNGKRGNDDEMDRSGSTHPGDRTPDDAEGTLPLVIVSVSNGAIRQAQRDQHKLNTFVAGLGTLPAGAVFVRAMTEAQGKALGRPFAKPSRRVAAPTSATLATASSTVEKGDDAPAQKKAAPTDTTMTSVASQATDARVATTAPEEDEDVVSADETIAASDPFLDALDVDESALTDLRELDTLPQSEATPKDPPDVQQEMEDVLDHIDDEALVIDAREDDRTRPFRRCETDGVVLVDPVGNGGDVDVDTVSNTPLVRSSSKKVVRTKKRILPETLTPSRTTRPSPLSADQLDGWSAHTETVFDRATNTHTPTAADSGALLQDNQDEDGDQLAIPLLQGPCSTARRFVGVKTVYLSDVLRRLVPPAANVLLIDKRAEWLTPPSTGAAAIGDVDSVRALVASDIVQSRDPEFGPRLLHPNAYTLVDNARAQSEAGRWLPTLLVFQSALTPEDAVKAEGELQGALRDVRRVKGRLGGVYVVAASEAEAASAALQKAVDERLHRHAPAYKPTISADQASPFSSLLQPHPRSAAPEDAERSEDAKKAGSARTPKMDSADEGRADESTHPPTTSATAANTAPSGFTIKLPTFGFSSWGRPRKAPTVPPTSVGRAHTGAAEHDVKPREEDSVQLSQMTPPRRPADHTARSQSPVVEGLVTRARHSVVPEHKRTHVRYVIMKARPSARTTGVHTTPTKPTVVLPPGFTAWAPGTAALTATASRVGPKRTSKRLRKKLRTPTAQVSQSHQSAVPVDAVATGDKMITDRKANAPRVATRLTEEEVIDAAVEAVLKGLSVEQSISVRDKQEQRSSPSPSPSLGSVVVSDGGRTAARRQNKDASQTSAEPAEPPQDGDDGVTPTTNGTTTVRASVSKTGKVDLDALVKQLIADATQELSTASASSTRATAVAGTPRAHAVKPATLKPARPIYAWKTVEPPAASTAESAPTKRTHRASASTTPHRGRGRTGVDKKKPAMSKAAMARAAKRAQQRSAASRRRLKAAAAAVQKALDEQNGVGGASSSAGAKGRGRKVKRPSPAFALPSPENYQHRASRAELMAVHQLLSSRVMPSAGELQSVPSSQAERLGRAASVYPGVNCHGNTKEKIQILTWFPPERFKEAYRHVSISARAAPVTVVLMAQRTPSPKVFVSPAQQDELVVRTVGAIVYACAKNEVMHPHRRHRIRNGRILCFIFRNDLSLHACERHQIVLERMLHAIKGFERAKVFVTTPLPSTKKRVTT